MTSENIFLLANILALPGWALLIFLPKWKWSQRIILYGVLIELSIIYLYLILTSSSEGDFNSLKGVALLFKNPDVLLAGWIHYIVFDLFIGCWEVRDSKALGIHHLLVVPCLILTLLVGPIGLLSYLLLRSIAKKQFFIEN